jgi:hypothetical protein
LDFQSGLLRSASDLVHCLASVPTALCWANVFHLFWTPVSSGSILWPIPSLASGTAVQYRASGQRLQFSACCANIFVADFLRARAARRVAWPQIWFSSQSRGQVSHPIKARFFGARPLQILLST